MIYTETGGYQGIGFAIPSNLARQVMDELIKNHEVARGTIGLIALRNVDPERAEAAGFGRLKGVLIYNMYRNSSAYRSGLQLEDIITKVNGQEIGDANQLQRLILDAKSRQHVEDRHHSRPAADDRQRAGRKDGAEGR